MKVYASEDVNFFADVPPNCARMMYCAPSLPSVSRVWLVDQAELGKRVGTLFSRLEFHVRDSGLMIGKADKRRPFAVAIALIAAIGAALIAPVVIGARRGEPIPGTTVRADSRESVTIGAPLTLFASPAVTLEHGTVALVGPASDESRVGALFRTLISGGGADLVLDGATITIDRTSSSNSVAPRSVNDAPSELGPVVSALSGFKFKSLTLLNVDIVIKTAADDVEISVASAEVTSDRGVVSAKGKLEYLSKPFDFDVAFAVPSGASDAPVKVRAALKGDIASVSFNGRLSPGDHGQIVAENAELSIASVRKLASWLGASWPSGTGLGAFTAKGLLRLDDRAITFEHAQFALDGNTANGTLMVKLGPRRPSIEGTLAFATFDVAPYATPSRPYALSLVADWLSAIRIPGLASPSFLRDMDADVRLSASNVVSGSDRLGRGAASLSIKDGKLYGEIAEVDLEQGGTGEGQFTVDTTAAEPRYTIRAELNDIDLETVVAPRLGPATLDGSGDIRMDLTASGATEGDLRKSLSGMLSLDMSEGGRLGLNLDALPGAAASASQAEGWTAATTGSTTVGRLTARFTASGGILTTDAVEAEAGNRNVRAAGTLDIDKSAVDLVISVTGNESPAETSKPAVGAFKIHGPWSAPTVTRAEPGKAARNTASTLNPG